MRNGRNVEWLPSLALVERLLETMGRHGRREATSLRDRIAIRAILILFQLRVFRFSVVRSEVLGKREGRLKNHEDDQRERSQFDKMNNGLIRPLFDNLLLSRPIGFSFFKGVRKRLKIVLKLSRIYSTSRKNHYLNNTYDITDNNKKNI